MEYSLNKTVWRILCEVLRVLNNNYGNTDKILVGNIVILLSHPVGKEIRDRFSGAVEAFSRKNNFGTLHREHTRHKTAEDLPSSKQVVSFKFPRLFC